MAKMWAGVEKPQKVYITMGLKTWIPQGLANSLEWGGERDRLNQGLPARNSECEHMKHRSLHRDLMSPDSKCMWGSQVPLAPQPDPD